MNRKLRRLAIVLALLNPQLLAAADASNTAEADRWTVVEVGSVGDLSVRLRVLKRASIELEDWMVLEFDNRGTDAVEIADANFSVDLKCGDVKTMSVSGYRTELFPLPEELDNPVRARWLRAKSVTGTRELSDLCAARLELPPESGFRVKARVKLRFDFKKMGRLSYASPPEGIEIDWQYPDESGLDFARTRLKTLLGTKSLLCGNECLRILTYLRQPAIRQGVSVTDILESVRIHPDRQFLLDHLELHHPGDPEVISYFETRLKYGDRSVIEALPRYMSASWSPTYVEPLFDLYQRLSRKIEELDDHDDDGGYARQRGLLHYLIHVFNGYSRSHSPDYNKPFTPEISERLSDAIQRQARYLNVKPSELPLDDRWLWRDEIEILGQTRDKKMIPRLRLLLDDKTVINELLDGLDAGGTIRPLRACDVAARAIIQILDGHVPDRRVQFPDETILAIESSKRSELVEQINRGHDHVILALKQRLAELDK